MLETKRVAVTLTLDQYNLARRRLFVESMSWEKVLRALVNAYITGDVSVSKQGRYSLAPPSNLVPQVKVPIDGDLVDIDVDWQTPSERPQVGVTEPRQQSRSRDYWGTREVSAFLRETTGRNVKPQGLRLLLRTLNVPKGAHKQWRFDGPNDKKLLLIIDAVKDGTYDSLIREGLSELETKRRRKQAEARDLKQSEEMTAEQRRIAHLKKLRNASK